MRRFAIIGLGMFGYYIAKFLYEKGYEVIAIDKDKNVIHKIRDFSTEAIIADAADKETLLTVGLEDIDVAVVGLGTNMDQSILVTMYLKEIGIKNIVVKAITEDHRKILEIIGATQIIFPEKDIALRVANSIISPNLLDYFPLYEGYSIIEFAPSKDFIGKSLSELRLRNKFHVQVIAIQEIIPEKTIMIPHPDFVIKDSDILIVMGKDEDLERMEKTSE